MLNDERKETLFSGPERQRISSAAPLAVRMRPTTLEEFVGQRHFLGRGKLLRRMLQADRLSSLIFYGPPGAGKTTLARIIACHTQAEFHYVSAPAATVKDLRRILEQAGNLLAAQGRRTVLFIDEIHRATTENPYFSVNSPLISRSTVFHFEPLSQKDVITLLQRALKDSEHGLGGYEIEAEQEALNLLAEVCDGDARRALTALEVGVLSQPEAKQKGQKIIFDAKAAKESIQEKTIIYDRAGDTHYDLASALQKSMRGSDPDATVYWLARMIAGGEDIRFIARRIAVCACEDVGNADPMATVLSSSAVQICEFVGLPEAQLALAQAALYVACAPKSNASAYAIWQALKDVKSGRIGRVPIHLKDSHYPAAKKLGYGAKYKYPHNFEQGYAAQEYMPAEVRKRYYQPKDRGFEKNIRQYLQKLERLIKDMRAGRHNISEQKDG